MLDATTNWLTNSHQTMLAAPPSDEAAAVAFLSEVAYDTEFFEEVAYANLVKALSRYPGLTGLVVDGALTRLDRPEYLSDAMTDWIETSIAKAIKAMEKVPSHEHNDNLLRIQLDILNRRFAELRKALPGATIVYFFRDDQLQFTFSKVLNERMLARGKELDREIGLLKEKVQTAKEKCRHAKKELSHLEGVSGSDATNERYNASRRLTRNERTIKEANEEISSLNIEKKYFRESKTRPLHQAVTRDFIEGLYSRVEEICDRHGVVMVTHDGIMRFNSLTIHYAHSAHKTWGVVKGRPEHMRQGVQAAFEDLMSFEDGSGRKRSIDALVESGHHGRPQTSMIKGRNHDDETNFRAVGFDGPVFERYVRTLSVLPFESRDKIKLYASGERFVRLAGGKPISSRNHEALNRYNNGAPTGLTILHKTVDGRTGVHWVSYKHFQNGTGILPMKHVIASASDEHLGGPLWQPTVLQGFMRMVRDRASAPFSFLGQQAKVAGVILPGDQLDADTGHWKFGKDEPNRNPLEVFETMLPMLRDLNVADEAQLRAMAVYIASVAMGGTVESMDDILSWGTDYFMDLIESVLGTNLQYMFVRIPGNHTGGTLASKGMNSNAFLRQRLIQRLEDGRIPPLKWFEVRRPGYVGGREYREGRIFLGGKGISLAGVLPDYGQSVRGQPLFGPLRLYVNHNPKGSGAQGLVKAGIGQGADVAIAGHTHEFYVEPYLMGEGRMGFAVRVPTAESVTDVEIYYAGNLLRVQGALMMAMPTPGQFAEEFVFVHHLRDAGRRHQLDLVRQALAKGKSK